MNTNNLKPHIVILGGGTGGVIMANLLGRKTKKLAEVTLVSNKENVLYEPDFVFRVFDKKKIEPQYKKLRKTVHKRVNILYEEVTGVDSKNQNISFESGETINYDYLVIATGAHYDYTRVPGYAEAAHHFYNEEATLKLRDAFANFTSGDIYIGIADLPYKCPIAPIEMTFMTQHYFKRRKLLDNVKIHFLSPLGGAFSIDPANERIEKKFSKKNIELHTFFNTEEIFPDKKTVESLEGDEIKYDLLVLVPPHVGATYISDRELADENGWIHVEERTLRSKAYSNIFAVGDVTNLPISKAGSSAHYQTKAASNNLINMLKGKEIKPKYNGHAQCLVQTSLTTAMLFDFTYDRPPYRIGYISNRLYYYVKKFFRPFFFRGVLTGRI